MSLIFDKEQALRVTGDDRSLVQELLQLFYEDYEQMLLQLRSAADENRTEEFTRTAHSLKGALANIGGMQASEQAAYLEKNGAGAERAEVLKLIDDLEEAINRFVAESKLFAG